MNHNLTEIIVLLDRSGSMQNLAQDTIGGFNAFIEKQKFEVGEARLTTILFDDQYEILHDGINIQDAQPLTEKEYFARGMTAMLDAIGKTLNVVGERLANTPEEERPGKVIVNITTDGAENASVEFKLEQINEMIKHQQDIYSWIFIFMGANIDAYKTAGSIGISQAFTANYTASDIGTQSVYCSMSKAVSGVRGCQGSVGEIGSEHIIADWNSEIQ